MNQSNPRLRVRITLCVFLNICQFDCMLKITYPSTISDSKLKKIGKMRFRFLAWVFLFDFFVRDNFSVFGSPPIEPPPCEPGHVRLNPNDGTCVLDRCAGVICEKNHAKCNVLADGETGFGADGEADTGDGFSCVLRCHSGWLRSVEQILRALVRYLVTLHHCEPRHVTQQQEFSK